LILPGLGETATLAVLYEPEVGHEVLAQQYAWTELTASFVLPGIAQSPVIFSQFLIAVVIAIVQGHQLSCGYISR